MREIVRLSIAVVFALALACAGIAAALWCSLKYPMVCH